MALGSRWRLGATHPSPEAYAASLWDGVHSHYVLIDRVKSKPLGVVILYNHDALHGFAYLAAARFSDSWTDRRSFLRVFARVVCYTFDALPIRKLYLETPDFNMSSLTSLMRRGLMQTEGILRSHRFCDRVYCDQYVLAIYASSVGSFREVIDERLGV